MAWTTSIPTRASAYDVLASDWNAVVGNLNFLAEIGYVEYTSPVSATATTAGTANQVVSLGAITYLAAPIMIEFYCPRFVTSAAASNYGILRDGTTVLGTIAQFSSTSTPTPIYIPHRITPTAASHTYNIAWWNSAAGTVTLNAGTGGAAGDNTAWFPGFIRARYIPT